MLWQTVSAVRKGVWGTSATFSARTVRESESGGTPPSSTSPCASSSLSITLMSEDLPQPLGPAIPMNFPAGIASTMSLRIS